MIKITIWSTLIKKWSSDQHQIGANLKRWNTYHTDTDCNSSNNFKWIRAFHKWMWNCWWSPFLEFVLKTSFIKSAFSLIEPLLGQDFTKTRQFDLGSIIKIAFKMVRAPQFEAFRCVFSDFIIIPCAFASVQKFSFWTNDPSSAIEFSLGSATISFDVTHKVTAVEQRKRSNVKHRVITPGS